MSRVEWLAMTRVEWLAMSLDGQRCYSAQNVANIHSGHLIVEWRPNAPVFVSGCRLLGWVQGYAQLCLDGYDWGYPMQLRLGDELLLVRQVMLSPTSRVGVHITP